MCRYKKTLIQIFLICILLEIGTFCLLLLNAHKHILVAPESTQIHYWFQVKNKYVSELSDKKKIVFLAGSGGIFGIRTDIIEKEIGIPVVNYCTHAGLGNYIFKTAKNVLRENDIVILPLEYPYYSNNKLGRRTMKDSTEYEYIISYDAKTILSSSLAEKQKILSYFICNLKKFKKEKLSGLEQENYNKLNKNGDNVSQREMSEEYAKTNSYYEKIKYDYNPNDTDGEFLQFIKWCKQKNIKVYAIAPNLNHQKKITPSEQKYFEHITDFYKKNDVKFLGDFEDSFYKTEDMFETIDHLNSAGQYKRTMYLINLLKEEV